MCFIMTPFLSGAKGEGGDCLMEDPSPYQQDLNTQIIADLAGNWEDVTPDHFQGGMGWGWGRGEREKEPGQHVPLQIIPWRS